MAQNAMGRPLPLGIQSFEKLRKGGFVYVDKTQFVYRLTRTSSPYFLSRPRRFGKSLLLSTLEAYFLGRRELFAGLAIEREEEGNPDAWRPYPVLKFSLAGGDFTKSDGLSVSLRLALAEFEQTYKLPCEEASLPARFGLALKNAYRRTGRPVVVLVDEYDNPLLKTMDAHPEQERQNRELYKGFFAMLKDCDEYLRFVLFTGVTKFSKVSIFSDLNQLTDISMDEEYAEICGITQEELEENFAPEISALAERNGMSRRDCIAELGRMYDGYHFHADGKGIYNPYSLLNAFFKKDFGSYWFGSGTPTFLINRLEALGFDARKFTDGSLYTTARAVSDYRPENPDPVPLLYQSGYLTIKGYDRRYQSYQLGYPNDEVKYGFIESLAPSYLRGEVDGSLDIRQFGRDIDAGDTDSLKERFTALFARLPYTADERPVEANFQNVLYIVFMLLGKFVHVELHSALGRADCVVETEGYVYLFEFKHDGSADGALAQIEEKGYAKPYAADSRTLFRVGVNFSTKERNITEWKALRTD